MQDIFFHSTIAETLSHLRETPVVDLQLEGRVTRAVGLTLEAVGFHQPVGSRCFIRLNEHEQVEAEIVGFSEDRSYLMCVGYPHGIAPGMAIIPAGRVAEIAVGDALLGRIINGAGEFIDKGHTLRLADSVPLTNTPLNPLERQAIRQPLDVGVRAINALFTAGQGQRMGLFAGSGVGKSVLLSMMTKFTSADVIVVGLIGERGREVKEFIEQNLGEEGLKRAVIVAAPADESPLMRLHGAMVATSIAEYFRDKGQQVLLLMDSLTRFAQAQREIALSIGEPPATKGYPPSVFAKLAQLIERAGMGCGQGGITAFYTVLTEGDDQQDPIADAARSFLDGHIVLSRRLAEQGQFPAIDVEASISRVMPQIVPEAQVKAAIAFKQMVSIYEKNRDFIAVGAYKPGADSQLDKAIELNPLMQSFIEQAMNEQITMEQSLSQLTQVGEAFQ